MTKERLLELIKDNNFQKVIEAVSVKPEAKTADPMKEYNLEGHEVFNRSKRPDIDIIDKDGNKTGEKRYVNRIALAFERMIVGRAAAFLCANPIVFNATPDGAEEEKFWAAFKRVNENTKLDYKNQSILEMRMSETEVAEIWYLSDLDEDDDYWLGTKVNAKKKARLFIAAPSLGDKLWPIWDGQDNLMAFAREWKEKTDKGEDIQHFDIYTPEKIYEGTKEGNTWKMEDKPNEVKGKIVVIYHSQPDVEWALVKTIISRLENIQSNFGDSNDKTAYPILALFGQVKGLPEGVAGRAIQMSDGASANYIAPPNSAESIKLEIEKLWMELHVFTDTVDISPDGLAEIGQVSGVAMEYKFMPAHLKASKHAGTFGECIQRRINLIKKMIVAMDPSMKAGLTLQITPKFDFFLPKDLAGIIDYLTAAAMGEKPILSQETAVNILQGLMSGDAKAEFEKIKAEMKEMADSKAALDKQFNE